MKLGNQKIKITKESYDQYFIYLYDQPTDNDCWQVIVINKDGTDLRKSWDRQERMTGESIHINNLEEPARLAIIQAVQDLDKLTTP